MKIENKRQNTWKNDDDDNSTIRQFENVVRERIIR